MRVSLNLVKKYIDIPEEITTRKIAYDLTLRTVEVEDVEDTSLKFHDIVVGKILEVKAHPNADKLKVCIVDIGENEPVQIVCGGINVVVVVQSCSCADFVLGFPVSVDRKSVV